MAFRSRRILNYLSHAIVMSKDAKEFAEEVVGERTGISGATWR